LLEEDSDGVRIMTVHSAKGLEFPVVVLADLMTGLSRTTPEQFVDSERKLCAVDLLNCMPKELRDNAPKESARDRAEGTRVAYVAATRAKDLLVIPAVGDEAWPNDGWLGPMTKAIYPSLQNWRNSTQREGCPKFGESTVLARPLEYDREGEISVRPGVIEPQQGSHEVVWWDPALLNLGAEPGQGIHQEVILKEDQGVSLAEYHAWETERATLLRTGAKPRYEAFLASQAVESPPGSRVSIEHASVARTDRTASDRKFGTLVHAILRDVPLDAREPQVRSLAAMNGRILGASAAEVELAVEVALGALAHPVMERARKASVCHREYPIVLNANGRLVEGILDLAFVEDDCWTIVDFKTGGEIAQHEKQLEWYAFALRELTSMPVRGVLLQI